MSINIYSLNQSRSVTKILSCFVLAGFIFGDVAWAYPKQSGVASNFLESNQVSNSLNIINDPSSIQFPQEFSFLQDVHSGNNGKLIIHIQDPHSNFSGQSNIASILDDLIPRYGVETVFVEGAYDNVSLSEFRDSLPNSDMLIAAKQLLFYGIISGEEYLDLTSTLKMDLEGIEDKVLYEKNIDRYKKINDIRRTSLNYLHEIKKTLNKIKHQYYPQHLIKLERQLQDFQTPHQQIIIVQQLARDLDIQVDEYTGLQNIELLKKLEDSIDYAVLNQELKLIMSAVSSSSRKKLSRSVEILSERRTPSKHLLYQIQMIMNAAKTLPIYQQATHIHRYFNYLNRLSKLDINNLLEEKEQLINDVYGHFLSNQDLLKIRAIDRYLVLLDKALKIKMTSDEFKVFYSNIPDFQTHSMIAFLNKKVLEAESPESVIPFNPVIDLACKDLVEFYTLVSERDLGFIERIGDVLKREQQDKAFLIAGGYHTNHLKTLLEEEGYSYVVLAPKINISTDPNRYEELLFAGTESTTYPKETSHNMIRQTAARYGAGARLDMMKGEIAEGVKSLVKIIDGSRLSVSKDDIEKWFRIEHRRLEKFLLKLGEGIMERYADEIPKAEFGTIEGSKFYELIVDGNDYQNQTVHKIVFDLSKLQNQSEDEIVEIWRNAYEVDWFESIMMQSASMYAEEPDNMEMFYSDYEFEPIVYSSHERLKQLLGDDFFEARGKSLEVAAGVPYESYALATAGWKTTASDPVKKYREYAIQQLIEPRLDDDGQKYLMPPWIGGTILYEESSSEDRVSSLSKYKDNEYDVVIASNLFHFATPQLMKRAINNMLSKARPGGKVVILELIENVQHMGWFENSINEISHELFGINPSIELDVRHVFEVDPKVSIVIHKPPLSASRLSQIFPISKLSIADQLISSDIEYEMRAKGYPPRVTRQQTNTALLQFFSGHNGAKNVRAIINSLFGESIEFEKVEQIHIESFEVRKYYRLFRGKVEIEGYKPKSFILQLSERHGWVADLVSQLFVNLETLSKSNPQDAPNIITKDSLHVASDIDDSGFDTPRGMVHIAAFEDWDSNAEKFRLTASRMSQIVSPARIRIRNDIGVIVAENRMMGMGYPPRVTNLQSNQAITSYLSGSDRSENTREIMRQLFDGEDDLSKLSAAITVEAFQQGLYARIFRGKMTIDRHGYDETEQFTLVASERHGWVNETVGEDFNNLSEVGKQYPDDVVNVFNYGSSHVQSDIDYQGSASPEGKVNIAVMEYLGDYVEMNTGENFDLSHPIFNLNYINREEESVYGRQLVKDDSQSHRNIAIMIAQKLTRISSISESGDRVTFPDMVNIDAGDFMFSEGADGEFNLKMITLRRMKKDRPFEELLDLLILPHLLNQSKQDRFDIEDILLGIKRGLVDKFGKSKGLEIYKKWTSVYLNKINERKSDLYTSFQSKDYSQLKNDYSDRNSTFDWIRGFFPHTQKMHSWQKRPIQSVLYGIHIEVLHDYVYGNGAEEDVVTALKNLFGILDTTSQELEGAISKIIEVDFNNKLITRVVNEAAASRLAEEEVKGPMGTGFPTKSGASNYVEDVPDGITLTGLSIPQQIKKLNKFKYLVTREKYKVGRRNFEKAVSFSDEHGAIDKMDAFIIEAFRRTSAGSSIPEDYILNPEIPLPTQLNNIGININDFKGQVFFHNLGDLVHKGPHGILVQHRSEELIDAGLSDFVIGNHGFTMFSNLMGVHLPWYRKFNTYEYTDAYDSSHGNINELLEAQHEQHDFQSLSDRDKKTLWAKRLYEFNQFHDSQQWDRGGWVDFDLEVNGEMVGGNIKKRKKETGFYQAVEDQKIGLTSEQELLWAQFRGWYVQGGSWVYTGVRSVGKMSLVWWMDLNRRFKEEYERIRNDLVLAGDSEAIWAWERAIEMMDADFVEVAGVKRQGIIAQVRSDLEEALEKGDWWWRAFEATNLQNYTSLEWWAQDDLFHKGWGTNILDELNFRTNPDDPRRIEKGDPKEVTPSNYFLDKELIRAREFFKNNFSLISEDVYMNTGMHAWLPLDDEGRFYFTYKGIEYRGMGDESLGYKPFRKGLQKIEKDIRGKESISDMWEALSLVNSWYADNTTESKIPNIIAAIKKHGILKIANQNGFVRLITGHLPFNGFYKKISEEDRKLIKGFITEEIEEKNIKGAKNLDWRTRIRSIVFLDHGASLEYGGAGAMIIADETGFKLVGFEHADFSQIVDNPGTLEKIGKMGYSILFNNPGIERDDFLNRLLVDIEDRIELLESQLAGSRLSEDNIIYLNSTSEDSNEAEDPQFRKWANQLLDVMEKMRRKEIELTQAVDAYPYTIDGTSLPQELLLIMDEISEYKSPVMDIRTIIENLKNYTYGIDVGDGIEEGRAEKKIISPMEVIEAMIAYMYARQQEELVLNGVHKGFGLGDIATFKELISAYNQLGFIRYKLDLPSLFGRFGSDYWADSRSFRQMSRAGRALKTHDFGLLKTVFGLFLNVIHLEAASGLDSEVDLINMFPSLEYVLDFLDQENAETILGKDAYQKARAGITRVLLFIVPHLAYMDQAHSIGFDSKKIHMMYTPDRVPARKKILETVSKHQIFIDELINDLEGEDVGELRPSIINKDPFFAGMSLRNSSDSIALVPFFERIVFGHNPYDAKSYIDMSLIDFFFDPKRREQSRAAKDFLNELEYHGFYSNDRASQIYAMAIRGWKELKPKLAKEETLDIVTQEHETQAIHHLDNNLNYRTLRDSQGNSLVEIYVNEFDDRISPSDAVVITLESLLSLDYQPHINQEAALYAKWWAVESISKFINPLIKPALEFVQDHIHLSREERFEKAISIRNSKEIKSIRNNAYLNYGFSDERDSFIRLAGNEEGLFLIKEEEDFIDSLKRGYRNGDKLTVEKFMDSRDGLFVNQEVLKKSLDLNAIEFIRNLKRRGVKVYLISENPLAHETSMVSDLGLEEGVDYDVLIDAPKEITHHFRLRRKLKNLKRKHSSILMIDRRGYRLKVGREVGMFTAYYETPRFQVPDNILPTPHAFIRHMRPEEHHALIGYLNIEQRHAVTSEETIIASRLSVFEEVSELLGARLGKKENDDLRSKIQKLVQGGPTILQKMDSMNPRQIRNYFRNGHKMNRDQQGVTSDLDGAKFKRVRPEAAGALIFKKINGTWHLLIGKKKNQDDLINAGKYSHVIGSVGYLRQDRFETRDQIEELVNHNIIDPEVVPKNSNAESPLGAVMRQVEEEWGVELNANDVAGVVQSFKYGDPRTYNHSLDNYLFFIEDSDQTLYTSSQWEKLEWMPVSDLFWSPAGDPEDATASDIRHEDALRVFEDELGVSLNDDLSIDFRNALEGLLPVVRRMLTKPTLIERIKVTVRTLRTLNPKLIIYMLRSVRMKDQKEILTEFGWPELIHKRMLEMAIQDYLENPSQEQIQIIRLAIDLLLSWYGSSDIHDINHWQEWVRQRQGGFESRREMQWRINPEGLPVQEPHILVRDLNPDLRAADMAIAEGTQPGMRRNPSIMPRYYLKSLAIAIKSQIIPLIKRRKSHFIYGDIIDLLELIRAHNKMGEIVEFIDHMKQNWGQILKNGGFAFDVDNTLLPKGITLDHPEFRGVRAMIVDMIVMGVPVAFITGNAILDVEDRVLEPIRNELRRRKAVLGNNIQNGLVEADVELPQLLLTKAWKNITVYPNSGASKYTLNETGVAIPDMDYIKERALQNSELALKEISEFMHKRSISGFGFSEEGAKQLKLWRKKTYPNIKWDDSWAEGNSGWEIDHVNESDFEKAKRETKPEHQRVITSPYIEKRYIEGVLVKLVVRPLPIVVGEDGDQENVRSELVSSLRKRLSEVEGLENLDADFAGSSSIDLMSKTGKKDYALEDFVISNTLDPRLMAYVGDAFFNIDGLSGNDEVVAESDLEIIKLITTLGVNQVAPENSKVDMWIGPFPQSILQLLKTLVRDTYYGTIQKTPVDWNYKGWIFGEYPIDQEFESEVLIDDDDLMVERRIEHAKKFGGSRMSQKSPSTSASDELLNINDKLIIEFFELPDTQLRLDADLLVNDEESEELIKNFITNNDYENFRSILNDIFEEPVNLNDVEEVFVEHFQQGDFLKIYAVQVTLNDGSQGYFVMNSPARSGKYDEVNRRDFDLLFELSEKNPDHIVRPILQTEVDYKDGEKVAMSALEFLSDHVEFAYYIGTNSHRFIINYSNRSDLLKAGESALQIDSDTLSQSNVLAEIVSKYVEVTDVHDENNVSYVSQINLQAGDVMISDLKQGIYDFMIITVRDYERNQNPVHYLDYLFSGNIGGLRQTKETKEDLMRGLAKGLYMKHGASKAEALFTLWMRQYKQYALDRLKEIEPFLLDGVAVELDDTELEGWIKEHGLSDEARPTIFNLDQKRKIAMFYSENGNQVQNEEELRSVLREISDNLETILDAMPENASEAFREWAPQHNTISTVLIPSEIAEMYYGTRMANKLPEGSYVITTSTSHESLAEISYFIRVALRDKSDVILTKSFEDLRNNLREELHRRGQIAGMRMLGGYGQDLLDEVGMTMDYLLEVSNDESSLPNTIRDGQAKREYGISRVFRSVPNMFIADDLSKPFIYMSPHIMNPDETMIYIYVPLVDHAMNPDTPGEGYIIEISIVELNDFLVRNEKGMSHKDPSTAKERLMGYKAFIDYVIEERREGSKPAGSRLNNSLLDEKLPYDRTMQLPEKMMVQLSRVDDMRTFAQGEDASRFAEIDIDENHISFIDSAGNQISRVPKLKGARLAERIAQNDEFEIVENLDKRKLEANLSRSSNQAERGISIIHRIKNHVFTRAFIDIDSINSGDIHNLKDNLIYLHDVLNRSGFGEFVQPILIGDQENIKDVEQLKDQIRLSDQKNKAIDDFILEVEVVNRADFRDYAEEEGVNYKTSYLGDPNRLDLRDIDGLGISITPIEAASGDSIVDSLNGIITSILLSHWKSLKSMDEKERWIEEYRRYFRMAYPLMGEPDIGDIDRLASAQSVYGNWYSKIRLPILGRLIQTLIDKYRPSLREATHASA